MSHREGSRTWGEGCYLRRDWTMAGPGRRGQRAQARQRAAPTARPPQEFSGRIWLDGIQLWVPLLPHSGNRSPPHPPWPPGGAHTPWYGGGTWDEAGAQNPLNASARQGLLGWGS